MFTFSSIYLKLRQKCPQKYFTRCKEENDMKQNKNYEKQNEITTGGVKGHPGALLWFLFGFDEISI